MAAHCEVSFLGARGKLAEILEKILKAELLRIGWTLEKTHDLERLLQSLVEYNSALAPAATPLCDAFAEVYFTSRYPGFDQDEPDWPQLRDQVESVAQLLLLARSLLSTQEPKL